MARGLLLWFLPSERKIKKLGVTVPFISKSSALLNERLQTLIKPVTIFSSFVRSFVSVKCRGHDGLRGDIDG